MPYERSLAYSYLSQVPMFRSCTDEQLDFLIERCRAVDAPEGREIIRQGDPGDEFYVVVHGTVGVERDGAAVAQLDPGDYFGELALFDPAPRNATVKATADASLLRLGRADFVAALDTMPSIRDAVLHGMAHRLHQLDARA
jgi:CRP/FNR family cyclic AMP-dependent transcriptional regulator